MSFTHPGRGLNLHRQILLLLAGIEVGKGETFLNSKTVGTAGGQTNNFAIDQNGFIAITFTTDVIVENEHGKLDL